MTKRSDQVFDELLLLQCQQGDQKAAGLLYKRWNPRVLKWSAELLRDDDLAQEIAQESWITIFKGLGSLKKLSLFRFWAYRIVYRRAMDYYRKQRRELELEREVELEFSGPDSQEGREVDRVELMLKAIQVLPLRQQQILRLFYLEQCSVKIIAGLIDLPEGTVKSRLFNARQQLKELINDMSYE